MFFLERSSPSICHTAWLWCHDWAFSLAGLSIVPFKHCGWTAQLNSGFEREREISGDSSLAAMLLYHFFTSNDFNRSKVPWNQTKKAQNMCLYPKDGKYYFFMTTLLSHSIDLWQFQVGTKGLTWRPALHMQDISQSTMPLYITTKSW